MYGEEEEDNYDPDMYDDFGEGFEEDFDSKSEKMYEDAFDAPEGESTSPFAEDADEDEDDFEFDSVVGGRDKKPVMSLLNKGKLSKYEMDDLLNQL